MSEYMDFLKDQFEHWKMDPRLSHDAEGEWLYVYVEDDGFPYPWLLQVASTPLAGYPASRQIQYMSPGSDLQLDGPLSLTPVSTDVMPHMFELLNYVNSQWVGKWLMEPTKMYEPRFLLDVVVHGPFQPETAITYAALTLHCLWVVVPRVHRVRTGELTGDAAIRELRALLRGD